MSLMRRLFLLLLSRNMLSARAAFHPAALLVKKHSTVRNFRLDQDTIHSFPFFSHSQVFATDSASSLNSLEEESNPVTFSSDALSPTTLSPCRPASSLPPRSKRSTPVSLPRSTNGIIVPDLSTSPSTFTPSYKNPATKMRSKSKKGSTARRPTRDYSPRLSKPTILSDQDLANHVSFEYIRGPRGVLRERVINESGGRRKLSTSSVDYDLGVAVEPETDLEFGGMIESMTSSSTRMTLNDLDHCPALVLNADYQPLSLLPLSLWHWQEAVKAIFNGKVTVVDVYPDVTIRAVTLEVSLPSVIALNGYVSKTKQMQQYAPSFTKRNVFLRDEYRCQYCLHGFHTRDLSLDHVVPRCHGGRLDWTNVVTCCHACNGRKGSTPIDQLDRVGMKLQGRHPRVPSQFELAAVANRMLPRRVHPTWKPYLPTIGMSSTATSSSTVPVAAKHNHANASTVKRKYLRQREE